MSKPDIRIDGTVATIHDAQRYADFDPRWFDREWWTAGGARAHQTTGRAGVLMLDRGRETWVYRHYHRGGFVSRLIYDEYLWTGAERTRPFREWRLLLSLAQAALPSPRPVAARAVRSGLIYRADILTVLLPDTQPLSSLLDGAWQDLDLFRSIGAMVARFHAAGCDHPDLTAHNILIDRRRRPFLVDFDNASMRRAGPWREAGVARLKRSLHKVSLETGTEFSEAAWHELMMGYLSVSA